MYSESFLPGVRGNLTTSGLAVATDQSIQNVGDVRIIRKLCRRPLRALSSPGVCGPRNSSRQIRATCAASNCKLLYRVLQNRCEYFSVLTLEVLVGANEVLAFQSANCVLDFARCQRHDGFAGGLLIAGIRQGIECHRIQVRRK